MASPQPGLFARPTYASVIAVYNEEAPDGVTRYDQATADKVVTAIAAVSSELHGADDGLDVVVGVGLPVWKQHCNGKGDPLPQGFADGDEEALRLDVLRNLPLQRDDGVAIVYIKYKDVLEPNSNPTTRAKALKSLNEFVTKAKDILSTHGLIGEDSGLRHTVQDGFVRPNEKIMGARFLDGSTNPSDAGAYDRNVLVAGPDHHAGGTFAITQKMFYQWEDIKSMSESAITRAVGRSQQDHEILGDVLDESGTHIGRTRLVEDADGATNIMLRQSFPYGYRKDADDFSREEGLYFVGFNNSISKITRVLERMTHPPIDPAKAATTTPLPRDLLMRLVKSVEGTVWYMPSATSLQASGGPTVDDGSDNPARIPLLNYWAARRPDPSQNDLLFYNTKEWLHRMSTGRYIATADGASLDTPACDTGSATSGTDLGPPSPRILRLAEAQMERWRNTWYRLRKFAALPHLSAFLTKDEIESGFLDTAHAAELKSRAIYHTLADVYTTTHVDDTFSGVPENLMAPNGMPYFVADNHDTFRTNENEIIVGVLETLSLASGKVVMPYFTDLRRAEAALATLSEASAIGHIVPDHGIVLSKGIPALIAEYEARADETKSASPSRPRDDDRLDRVRFLKSAALSLRGVQAYLRNYAKLCRRDAAKARHTVGGDNLDSIAVRLDALADGGPPRSFLDALQLLFTMHACLHLTGEAVSLGRVDQLLQPFYEKDIESGAITHEEAQEAIDAFFLKFSESPTFNMNRIDDVTTFGQTAVTYTSGAYPGGDGVNQWIQQLTLGGYEATDDEVAHDASNDVTMMCLRASRRLPITAPCVSLRLTPETPDAVLDEAARAIKSGGAHPILFNDDKMVAGLHGSGKDLWGHTGTDSVALRSARNYACDGCYEAMMVGETEFAFSYVPMPAALERAINGGSTVNDTGPLFLRGRHDSRLLTKYTDELKTMDDVKARFREELETQVSDLYVKVLGAYGNLWQFCPSPLLSVGMHGCYERARDLSHGGANYHIVAPMLAGFSTTVDSLVAIEALAFNEATAVTTLEELVMVLRTDWGAKDLQQIRVSDDHGATYRTKAEMLRAEALQLPKFGSTGATGESYEMAKWVAETMVDVAHSAMYGNPLAIAAHEKVRERYFDVDPDTKWEIIVQPGVGTFEAYNALGLGLGASADGRRAGQPIASDASPAPLPQDLPETGVREVPLYKLMGSYTDIEPLNTGVADACPVDIGIREDFPLPVLAKFLRRFARGPAEDGTQAGIGPNLLTISTANAATMAAAKESPQQFDAVRLRMGGWSNFFVSMFTAHQLQHMRRPVATWTAEDAAEVFSKGTSTGDLDDA